MPPLIDYAARADVNLDTELTAADEGAVRRLQAASARETHDKSDLSPAAHLKELAS